MALWFQFAQPLWLMIGLSLVVIAIFIRVFWSQPTMYQYPLVHFIKQHDLSSSSLCTKFFFWIRLISLFLMAILVGKPQFVDSKSKITIDGIDIMLALDVSGSMRCFDDLKDQRTRLEVAKAEALSFIDKRQNDAIGLVIFGRYAIVRCPLTLDKLIIKEIVDDLEIGQPSVDMQQETKLSQGLITAIRHLQKSKSKSKIVVLLTDGAPSPGDLNPEDAIKIAKELGVKVYTIGIGSDKGVYINDPTWGIRQVDTPINKELLRMIAKETGGTSFEAKKPEDLKKIYGQIDQLEKQSYETQVYQKYSDYFMPIVWLVIGLLLFELFMATFVWFIV